MFGYVNIYKDELKVRDYETFRAYYCSLCESIGKRGSQIARMGLSYDMAFLAVLLSSIEEEKPEFKMSRCVVHPGVKRRRTVENRDVAYAARMSVLLGYLKFLDDWQDDHSIKAVIGMVMYHRAVRKARKSCGTGYAYIREQLKKQSKLEKENCADIDMVADCFAKILEELFTPEYITDPQTRRVLGWMGYNTGRWIYIIDAYCDMEKDLKDKSYNPFIAAMPDKEDFTEYKRKVAQHLDFTQTYTLGNIASAYELLNIRHNREILENIIYIGLKFKQDTLLGKKGEQNEPV